MTMTLSELQKLIPAADPTLRVPTPKKLSDSEVALQKIIDTQTTVTVYANGYCMYRAGKRATVFPLHKYGNYEYAPESSDASMSRQISADEQPWYLMLLLYGEDSIEHNQQSKRGIISYSAVSEDWCVLQDHSMEAKILEKLMDEESIREVFSLLDEKEKEAIYDYYYLKLSQKEIGERLSMSQQSVSYLLEKTVKKIRKFGCNNDTKKTDSQ